MWVKWLLQTIYYSQDYKSKILFRVRCIIQSTDMEMTLLYM